MDSYLSEYWWGYLTHIVIEKCVALSKEKCPGCAQGFKTSLLHVHQQASLLNKIETYLNESRGLLSSNFDEMFADFRKRVEFEVTEDEKQVLITSGRSFLFIVTPPSLFYGRFLTEEKYSTLFAESYNPKSPSHPPKRKRPRPPHQESDNNIPKKKKISKPPIQTPLQTSSNSRWNSTNFDGDTDYDM